MPIYIITIGIFILVSAFSYSILASRETSSSLLVDADSPASKEVMAMMSGEMGPMMMSDGTYSSEVRYEVPYGYVEPMSLVVTVEDGVITESVVDFEVANPVSGDYVRSFERYYKDQVIGKPITEVSLARFGGASLTNVAFDAALEKIKVEAAGGTLVATTEDEALPLLLPGTPTEDGIVLGPVPATPSYTDADLKDGTYSSAVRYEVPFGSIEIMNLKMTVTEGVVTDSKVVFEMTNPVSESYARSFDNYYRDEVVGQSLAEVSLARVGGASLTNAAFDAALKNIKTEASGNTIAADADTTLPLPVPELVIRGIPNLAEIAATSKNKIHLVTGPLPGTESSTNNTSPYADGRYVVVQSYYAWPNFYEPMQTVITLENGIIVAADQAYSTVDYTHSIQYQRHFDSIYKNVVIGMPLTDAPIARIGQASETTDGFNDALLAIKEQAQKQ
tara:strand:+ start:7751 stop:9094 length:1344 start_codon:yes stop_codon:yes gene_type:complete